MKFQLSLKSTHQSIIDDLKEKYSISSNEEVVIRSVKSAFQLQNNDLIFAKEREQCVGGCYGSEPCFEIEMDDTDYNQLKQIFKDYDFEDYDSEEEEISKTIRCIINFIEEEPESISIWVWTRDVETRSWSQEGSEREGMVGKRNSRGFSDLISKEWKLRCRIGV